MLCCLKPAEYGTVIVVAFPIILASVLYICLQQQRTAAISLPWVGGKKGWLSMIRANLRECYWPGSNTITQGYAKFNLQGQPFLVPDISLRPHVIIPHQQCQWLITLPPSVVSSHDALRERIALKYIIPFYDQQDLVLMKIAVRRGLTQNLSRMQEEMFYEVQQTIDNVLGVDREWKEITLPHKLEEILRRIGARMTVGSTLSRDEGFNLCMQRLGQWFGAASFVVGQLTPWPLKPVIALVFRPIVGYYHKQVAWYLNIMIDNHIKLVSEGKGDALGGDGNRRNLLTAAVDALLAQQKTLDINTTPTSFKSIFATLVVLGSLSMHGTLINTFLDLLSSDPALGYYDAIRKEAEITFPAGKWAETSKFSRHPCAESAIRESMRLNPGSTRLLSRIVIAEEGLVLPNGSHVPKNSTISLAANIQRDGSFYSHGDKYNALRFAFPDPSDQARPQSLAATSDIFMTFGYGTHMCPGRLFAAQLMTMIVSYITLHYDAEPLQQRPSNTFLADFSIPSQSCKIRLRRRVL